MTATEAHDPTASATRYPAMSTAQTSLSRNETETLCLKAARGAGMAWGMAEEAAFAAGWLSGAGVDGASLLLRHLQKMDVTSGIPIMSNRHWRATANGALCPIVIGVALDDRAQLDDGPCSGAVTISTLRYPCLAVPFLARMARTMHVPFWLEWDCGGANITETGEIDDSDLLAMSSIQQCGLSIAPFGGASVRPTTAPAPAKISSISAVTLENLNALAMRTTVPASHASRQGAGATTNDND